MRALLASLAAALAACSFLLVAGCKDSSSNPTAMVMEAIKPEQVKKLKPDAENFIAAEFAGIDLEVTADDTNSIPLDKGTDMTTMKKALVLEGPVFKAKNPDGITELTGARAYIDQARKTVYFDSGVSVTGPRGGRLEADTLTWHYTKELLTADGNFTLESNTGKGIVTGSSFRSDVAFTKVLVE